MAVPRAAAIVSNLDGQNIAPASLTSQATLFTQDMTGYAGISVTVTSAGTTCTITYETTNDPTQTTWHSVSGITSSSTGTSAALVSTTTTVTVDFPRRGKYFRARVSTYTSGTVTVAYTLLGYPTMGAMVGAAAANPITGSAGVSGGAGVTQAATQRVVIASDDAMMTSIRSPGLSINVSVTRTADTNAYTAGDVLGPSVGATAGIDFNLGAISASKVMLMSTALELDRAAIISGETSYTLHLYNVTPPSAIADNGAFDLPAGDRASYLGSVNLGTPVDLGSTLYVEVNNIWKLLILSGTHIFGYLVTVGAYTPTSAAVHKITLNFVQY